MNVPAQRPPERGRTLAFAVAAILLPLVVLVALEAGLRLAGVASDDRTVFIPLPGQEEYQALNPDYARRYFRDFVPGVSFTPFRIQKADSTFRVFVLGGSTTAGFPYRFFHGFPGRMEQRLRADLFGRPVEVVNLAMSAVSSYTVWDLALAALREQPDALVVYAGHNEYYGAFGTGSTEGRLGDLGWLKRLVIRLRRSVLFTLVERAVEGDRPPPVSDRTLMAEVVRDADIRRDGPVFRAGVRQFEDNLGRVLRAAAERNVPVFIGTLTSNLAGVAPFTDDPAAAAAFERGRALLAAGDPAAARLAFVEARELDGIRFRAPGAMNEVIRRLAAEHGAHLVDVEDVFRQNSPSGVEDDRLFTDHLHPDAEGYTLIGEAFLAALRETFRWTPHLESAPDSSLDDVDAAFAAIMLERLRTDYPFNKTDPPEVIARRHREHLDRVLARGPRADSLAARIALGSTGFPEAQLRYARDRVAAGDTARALRTYRSLLFWQPFNRTLIDEAIGLGLGSAAHDGQTDPIALWAASTDPRPYELAALGTIRLRRGLLDDADVVLSAAERADPDDPVILFNLARLRVLQGDTLAARSYFERYAARR